MKNVFIIEKCFTSSRPGPASSFTTVFFATPVMRSGTDAVAFHEAETRFCPDFKTLPGHFAAANPVQIPCH